ncbi:hypothetical protein AX17_000919 [Amanita inopinata Kibby_2008]|nr:hypothetical protein AX17_000919 [Amanita inopinata Kibby_2008]
MSHIPRKTLSSENCSKPSEPDLPKPIINTWPPLQEYFFQLLNVTASNRQDTVLYDQCEWEGLFEDSGGIESKESINSGYPQKPGSMTFFPNEPEIRGGEVPVKGWLNQTYMVPHSHLSACDQDALRAAYALRRNLVLDSIAPHIAPHIVITPPEETVEDYCTPWLNSAGPQCPTHLMAITPPNAMDHSLNRMLAFQPSQASDSGRHAAKAVFNVFRFKSFVVSPMHESASMYNIVIALHRHCRKAVAFAASEAARARSTAKKEYMCSSEKPFRWVDPAEVTQALSLYVRGIANSDQPFLLRTNQYRGTTVIESPSPFSVPHIIINEPPPQDPWVIWHNTTTNPQDYGSGRYLVVPYRMVLYTNSPDGAEDYWGSPFPPRHESQVEQLQEYTDVMDIGPVDSPSDSEPSTPCPSTPLDELMAGGTDYGFFSDEDSFVPRHSTSVDPRDGFMWNEAENDWVGAIARKIPSSGILSNVECTGLGQASLVIPDGEQDELPPFDEWYQSVATRIMQMVVPN